MKLRNLVSAVVAVTCLALAARAEISDYLDRCTLRWDFDDPDNLLAATLGADAVVGAGTSSVVEGLGGCYAVTDPAALAGLADGDGAIAIPKGQHLRLSHALPTDGLTSWGCRLRVFTPASSMGTYRSFFYVPGDGDQALYITKANQSGIVLSDSSPFTSVALVADTWNTIEIVYDGASGTTTLYQNGESSVSAKSGYNLGLKDAPVICLSGDNDGDDDLLYFSCVEFFSSADYPLPDSVASDELGAQIRLTAELQSLTERGAVFGWTLENLSSETEVSVFCDVATDAEFTAVDTFPVDTLDAPSAGVFTVGDLSLTSCYYVRFRAVGTSGDARSRTLCFTTLRAYKSLCTARWDFDDPDNLLAATLGADAVVAKTVVNNETGVVQEGLGDCSFVAGITDSDGAISIPLKTHLLLDHGLPTDGTVSWACRMRVLRPSAGGNSLRSIFYVPGTSDQAIYIAGSDNRLRILQSGGNSGGSEVSRDLWHTIKVFHSADTRETEVWLDGVLSMRRVSSIDLSLRDIPRLCLSGDNDGDDDTLWFSSVEFFNSDAYPLPTFVPREVLVSKKPLIILVR